MAVPRTKIDSLRTCIERPRSSDRAQWDSVIEALVDLVAVFEDWSDTLDDITRQTNKKTIQDMADGLKKVKKYLQQLDEWLADKTEQYWVTLKAQLEKVQLKYRDSSIRAALSAYYHVELPEDEVVPLQVKQREQMRFDAVNGIDDFVKELRQAIKYAQTEATRLFPSL